MNPQKVFKYRYPFFKDSLLNKLNDRHSIYHNWNCGEYLIRIKNDNRFFLGVERVGHSSGYWFVADIDETASEGITISGKIIYEPDDDGNEQIKSFKDKISKALLYVILSPVILICNIIDFFHDTCLKISKKPIPLPNPEIKLDKFMIEYLCCQKI